MFASQNSSCLSGWLLLNKPVGVSSCQALRPLKKLYHTKRVGHCGTLDPFAEGLLLVVLGRATRLLPYTHHWYKRYELKIAWGAETTTGDLTGDVVAESAHRPTPEAIYSALPSFCGEIMQTPPAFSAVKVNGQRAYALARKGEMPALKARKQHVRVFKLLACEKDWATFEVLCDRGTYVRALATDLAKVLGTTGHLCQLKRTAIGPFEYPDALGLDFFEKTGQNKGALMHILRSPRALLDDIPELEVDQTMALHLTQGRSIESVSCEQGFVFCLHQKTCVALARVEGSFLWPKVVFV